MDEISEKLSITVNDKGVKITRIEGEGKIPLRLSAMEALMLLDILRNEESMLKEIVEQSCPLPLKISF